mgnify:CR=1 FL=1
MPKPRWESLHPIEGILEMYAATGEADYREAFQRLWWSMTATDLHNTGGFSTWEQAKGDPYQEGPSRPAVPSLIWLSQRYAAAVRRQRGGGYFRIILV